jgi:uncharacterized membrane protein YraQ (UPF0718 family)
VLSAEELTMVEQLLSLLAGVATQVAVTLAHNWPFLLIGIVGAAAIQVYVGPDTVAGWLRRRRSLAITGSVGAAVATPLCSCGTTAVVLSMLASSVPWAPMVAFMVASPLTSPSELLYSAGLFGWGFALTFFVGSIAIGLAAGGTTVVVERLGWLRNQARHTPESDATACNTATCDSPHGSIAIGSATATIVESHPTPVARWRLPQLGQALLDVTRRTLPLFVGFAALGYLVTALVPQNWITAALGGNSPLSTVTAATLGIPFYLNSDGSLPFVANLMQGGMGPGPAMAFLVTGAGTSLGAISGGLLIARWRVLALVVASLWIGAIVLGLTTSALAIG